jgi:hypothetical protein
VTLIIIFSIIITHPHPHKEVVMANEFVDDIRMNGFLNRLRSTSLGEKHHSKGRSNSSRGKVSCESGQNGTAVSVTSRNSAPNGLYFCRYTLNLFSALPE